MPRKCCVLECSSNYRGTDYVTVFRFPTDEVQRTKWIRAIPRKDFNPSKDAVVCIKHFAKEFIVTEDCIKRPDGSMLCVKRINPKLSSEAYPSVFSTLPSYLSPEPQQMCQMPEDRHAELNTKDEQVVGTSRKPLQDRLKQVEATMNTQASELCTPSTSSSDEVAEKEHSYSINDPISLERKMNTRLEKTSSDMSDVPFKTSGKHFTNIAETLVKYRENGILCDAVLVSKCGRELRAHSVLLAAVSHVFLMAIQEKPSSGLYHLCFPEVELEVLEIAVHFIYTGKLLLPPLYSQMNQLSKLFDKLSVLGLSSQKLHECKMTFVRSAKQPSTLSESVKAEDADNKPRVKDSMHMIQESDEWPVDNKPSSTGVVNRTAIVDITPGDDGTSHMDGDSVENSQNTLAKQKGQGCWKKEWQKGKAWRAGFNINKKERMPSNVLVQTGTILTKACMKPAFSVIRLLHRNPNTSPAALQVAGSQKLNNFPVELLLDQNMGKISNLDSGSNGTHEVIVNENGKPSLETRRYILNLVDPSLTEESLGPNVIISPECLKDHRLRHTCEKPYECPDCKKYFMLQRNMKNHQSLHTGYRPFLCEFCGKGFIRKTTLMDHVTACHKFECALCSCTQTSKADMQKHALEVHQIGQPVKFHTIIKNPRGCLCDLCGNSFISAHSLQKHIKRHRKKVFHCDTCGEAFSNSCVLRIHMRVHIGERPFVCDICEKGFAYKSTLMTHLTVHSGIKPFDCAICSKSFASKAQLKQHMKQHMIALCQRNLFMCTTCNKKFTSKTSLIVHNRIHTGERPYKCRLCSKQFSTKSALTVHIRSHTGDKPFSCTICKKSFADSAHLTRHMRTHTEEKPFVCEICSKSYKNKVDLRYHFLRFHKIDIALKSASENTDIDRTVKVPDSTDRSDCKL